MFDKTCDMQTPKSSITMYCSIYANGYAIKNMVKYSE